MRSALIIATVALSLTGCGPAENDPGPGGVTVGEARALDEAAAMLDAQKPVAAAEAAAPAPRDPKPSAIP